MIIIIIVIINIPTSSYFGGAVQWAINK